MQRSAEREILDHLRRQLGIPLDCVLRIGCRIELDGFQDGPTPICVEVFAHQGPSKPGQRRKVMTDMGKLVLVERLLGRTCRKILAVCDSEALRFLDNSWQGRFAEEFSIERLAVNVPEDTREALRQAQRRQFR